MIVKDFDNMDKRDRARFINSLSGFKSLCLVGSKDKNGKTNLAPISSVFHIGADPALMGMIFRPHSTPRHSLENIIETNSFTLNHVHKDILHSAHQASARYDKEESEFIQTNLEEEYLNGFYAPFVKDSRLKLGLKYEEHQTLKINNTVLLIASIDFVSLSKDFLRKDMSVDIERAGTLTVSGLDCYHETTQVARLSYAKKDRDLTEI